MDVTRTSAEPLAYDVVVVGGAVSGASTAILLKRGNPNLRILVIEKSEKFDWKVGESTVEVSAYFLTRVLKQWTYLSRDQLPKQAFRYWFFNDEVTCLREASETGPTQMARTPSFQLDRAKLDTHLLELAAKEGSEVWRPAKVTAWSLGGEERGPEGAGLNRLTVEKADGTTAEVSSRWLVDATGRQAMLARKRGGVTPIDSHPIAAIWVRYNGVKDLDGVDFAGTDPGDPWQRTVIAPRRAATNHFTGWGYWIWFIPLHDGEMSVGLVWDKRLVNPEGRTPLEKLTRFLDGNPLTRELIEGAIPIEGDCRYYAHLPYFVDKFVGPGWACVGDAGGFLDPFYSPGSDFIAISNTLSTDLITRYLDGEDVADRARKHDDLYLNTYRVNLTQYEGQYEFWQNAMVMTVKICANNILYWGTECLLFFHDKYADVDFMASVRADLERIWAITRRLEAMYREWNALENREWRRAIVPTQAFPGMFQRHVDMAGGFDDDGVRARLAAT
ncbi:MAG TPA: hypothetical protein VKG23_03630, partial [Thermoanaerobaculia bacterium]|nr:hypothetical protein [Thermoanaerobaculia bacterium]